MKREAEIVITFTDWWLSGTGRAGAGDLDAVPHRDRFGCPAMPMTQVKGQLRESANRLAAANAGGWTKDHVERLLGDEGKAQAALAFRGDATLAPAAVEWFRRNPSARRQLSRRRASTRIDKLGVAQDDMLRAVEAAVPLEIAGTVLWIGEGEPDVDWIDLLDKACAATLAFGKLKTDGYGRGIARCRPRPPGGGDE